MVSSHSSFVTNAVEDRPNRYNCFLQESGTFGLSLVALSCSFAASDLVRRCTRLTPRENDDTLFQTNTVPSRRVSISLPIEQPSPLKEEMALIKKADVQRIVDGKQQRHMLRSHRLSS